MACLLCTSSPLSSLFRFLKLQPQNILHCLLKGLNEALIFLLQFRESYFGISRSDHKKLEPRILGKASIGMVYVEEWVSCLYNICRSFWVVRYLEEEQVIHLRSRARMPLSLSVNSDARRTLSNSAPDSEEKK